MSFKRSLFPGFQTLLMLPRSAASITVLWVALFPTGDVRTANLCLCSTNRWSPLTSIICCRFTLPSFLVPTVAKEMLVSSRCKVHVCICKYLHLGERQEQDKRVHTSTGICLIHVYMDVYERKRQTIRHSVHTKRELCVCVCDRALLNSF